MLQELHVRDLALVDTACVTFGPGLNLLTGETGSGKSLIVDALGLALGDRASTDQVRLGADRASVEARFATPVGELTLAREVGRRGAARVDGKAASPAQLRELGRTLVAVHGEDEDLTAERAAARHAVRLQELMEAALAALRGDQGLPAAVSDVRGAAELDRRLEVVAGRLEALSEEVADVGAELRRYAEAIDTDP